MNSDDNADIVKDDADFQHIRSVCSHARQCNHEAAVAEREKESLPLLLQTSAAAQRDLQESHNSVDTCKSVPWWLLMRTNSCPVCAARYATSDVLPLDVGPCVETAPTI